MNWNVWDWFVGKWPKIIVKLLSWLTEMDGEEGLSWRDFEKTVDWIKRAEFDFGTGEERREWVIEQINNVLNKHKGWIIELLFSVALNYANRLGDIKLGGSR